MDSPNLGDDMPEELRTGGMEEDITGQNASNTTPSVQDDVADDAEANDDDPTNKSN